MAERDQIRGIEQAPLIACPYGHDVMDVTGRPWRASSGLAGFADGRSFADAGTEPSPASRVVNAAPGPCRADLGVRLAAGMFRTRNEVRATRARACATWTHRHSILRVRSPRLVLVTGQSQRWLVMVERHIGHV